MDSSSRKAAAPKATNRGLVKAQPSMPIARAVGQIDDVKRIVLVRMAERFEIAAGRFMNMFVVIAMLAGRRGVVA